MGGKWIYRKTEPRSVQGVCVRCGKNKQKSGGVGVFRPICRTCDRELYGVSVHGQAHRIAFLDRARRNKATYKARCTLVPVCERCGFVAKDNCQIDIHHKDRNRKNNEPENLETLCANCHRLEHSNEKAKRKKLRTPGGARS